MAEAAKVEVKIEAATPPAPVAVARPVEQTAPVAAAKVEAKPVVAAKVAVKPAVAVKAIAKPAAKKAAAKPMKKVAIKAAPAAKTVAAKVAVKKTIKKPVAKRPTPTATFIPLKQLKAKAMTMNETIKKQTETAISQGKEAVAQFQTKAKEVLEQGTKSAEELNTFAKGNVEALVEAGRVAAKGLETLTQTTIELTKKNAEATTTAVRSFTTAKSANELFQLQSDFARSQFDKLVADGSKMTEMFVKLAGEAFEPISNRFAVAADKFAKVSAR